ncbi:MAG: DUF1217 domain-containing protein [Rhodospirillales bacterium]|nr:DUF1217 domain-containing protein [Rhodospirillales bacterium]
MSFTATDLALFGSASTAVNPILSAIYGSGGGSGTDPVQALQIAQATQTQEITQTEQQPAVARDIAAFETAVSTATSPAQLLANPTVQKVLLTASGMSDQIGFSALATQALLSNSSDPTALVNQLSDTRWLTVNQTYNFATQGLSVIQTPSVLADITKAYAQQTWYQSLDAITPGLSNALDFMSQASTITSASQILGNPSFFNVVTTALGIPQQIVFQDPAAQQQAITAQLDISRLQDPTYVQGITDQYLIAMQQQSGSTAPSLDSLAVQAAGLVA